MVRYDDKNKYQLFITCLLCAKIFKISLILTTFMKCSPFEEKRKPED